MFLWRISALNFSLKYNNGPLLFPCIAGLRGFRYTPSARGILGGLLGMVVAKSSCWQRSGHQLQLQLNVYVFSIFLLLRCGGVGKNRTKARVKRAGRISILPIHLIAVFLSVQGVMYRFYYISIFLVSLCVCFSGFGLFAWRFDRVLRKPQQQGMGYRNGKVFGMKRRTKSSNDWQNAIVYFRYFGCPQMSNCHYCE